jgi:hypothetical protein
MGATSDWLGASRQLQERLQGKSEAMAPVIGQAGEALQAPMPSPPPPPTLTQPPSRQLTEFLAPVEGESPQASISKLLTAVSLFATGISGAARGDARAGLAAFKGAMEGWQAGDILRSDRAFADWKAANDAMLAKWSVERQAYQDIMAAANLDLEQKFKLVQLTALAEDNKLIADIAEKGDLEKLIGFLGERAKFASELELAAAKLISGKEEKEADREQRMRIAEMQTENQRLSREAMDLFRRESMGMRAEAQGLQRETLKAGEADRIRDDFMKAGGEFVKVRDSYARVLASAKEPSAAGDLSLIFNYMKMLDPGSVVRESEFATAAASGSLGERVKGQVAKIQSGQRLSDNVRKDFVDRSNALYSEALKSQLDLEAQFKSMAQRRQLDVERAVPDLPGRMRTVGPTAAPTQRIKNLKTGRIAEGPVGPVPSGFELVK